MIATLEDLLAEAPRLESPPHAAVALLYAIEDPSAGADKFIPLIEQDPKLEERLLKLCNSPAYRTGEPLRDAKQALVWLGNKTFIRALFTTSMEPVLRQDLPGYKMGRDSFWRHALAVGYGGAFLMDACGASELKNQAFTAGLLHDIGKLLLDPVVLNGGGVDLDRPLESELDITGTDHTQISGLLLDSWRFPAVFREAAQYHHQPSGASEQPQLVEAIHAVNLLYRDLGKVGDDEEAVMDAGHCRLDSLSLPDESVETLVKNLAAKTDAMLAIALGGA